MPTEEYPEEFHARGSKLYELALEKNQDGRPSRPGHQALCDTLACIRYDARIRKNEKENPGEPISTVKYTSWQKSLKQLITNAPYELQSQLI